MRGAKRLLRAVPPPKPPHFPATSKAPSLILSPFEWTIAKRYMLPGRGEAVIALVASISIGVVMLSVAMLVIVMSVMNGFRAELLDRIDDALTALVAAEPDAMTRLRESMDVLTDAMLSHLSYEERELVEPLAAYGYA